MDSITQNPKERRKAMSWAEEQDWFGMEDALALRGFDDPEDAIERGYWIMSDWEPIRITAMTDKHLANSIRMIEEGRLNRKWALPYLYKERERRKKNHEYKHQNSRPAT